MSDSNTEDKLRALRLRLEGGGKCSDIEHGLIEKLNSKFALVIYETQPTVSLAMQSLGEMLLSACANDVDTPEQFMKNVYTFMKDYWLIQAEKYKDILIERIKENREKLKTNPNLVMDNIYQRAGEPLRSGMVISGSPEEIIEKITQLMGGATADDCDCADCIARRKREAEQAKTEPQSKTKH